MYKEMKNIQQQEGLHLLGDGRTQSTLSPLRADLDHLNAIKDEVVAGINLNQ